MFKLAGTDGSKFLSWILKPGKYKIGRTSKNDFSIQNKTVSSKHALIEVDDSGEKCFLTDLGSHNGTFVNGARISDRVGIKEGDAIMFSNAQFKIFPADNGTTTTPTMPEIVLSEDEPLKSVYLSIDEALKPLPRKVSDLPELMPTLFEMVKMLVLTETREVMLEKSLQIISRIIPAERLVILFVSEDEDGVITAASIPPMREDSSKLTLSRTIAKEIITKKSSILISDPQNDPRFADQKSIIMSKMKSAMAVPLFDEGKVLGILYADTTNPLHSYNDDYLRLLATFGNIIASRLLNYILLQERQEKQIMEAELTRAASIQKNLLVTTPPQISGYSVYTSLEQSRSVGGDMFDLKPLKDGRLLFLVADVSGKGMGAALLMSNILASFRILYDSEEFDLMKAVKRVSIQLFNNSLPGDFATLFVGLADPLDGKISYINAGHNPPVLVRKNGAIEHLDSSGTMIGAFDFSSWQEETVDLAEGDLLFIFSDGVTEAERGEDQFGEERMEHLLMELKAKPIKEIASCLMDNINDFMGDAPRSDDITMLILKKESK